MKKNLLWMLGALLTIVSCNTSDVADVTPAIVDKITFATGDIKTRVSGSQFESGDAILVEAYTVAGDLHASTSYSYDGDGTFTTNSPIAQNGESKLAFAAVYPSNATASSFATDFEFTVAADQSSEDSYEMSDMLAAKVDATSLAKPTLTFYHTMAVIDVKVDGAASLDDCAVALSAMNVVVANITNGTYDSTGSVTTLTPLMTSEGFRVIVAPQTLATGELATMTIGGNTYTWTLSASSALLSGYRYSYTWEVNEATGESEVTFTGSIGDWGDGEWNSGSTEGGDGNSDVDLVEKSVSISPSDFTEEDAATFTNGTDGLDIEDEVTIGDFTFSFVDGTSTNTRLWVSSSAWQIRAYAGSETTISSDKTIVKIEMTGSNLTNLSTDGGVTTGGVWEGSSKSVTFAHINTSGTVQITSIAITYLGEDDTTTEPDTDQGGSSESEGFVLNSETLGYAGSSNAEGTATVGGVEWSYYGVSATDSFGTTYIELDDPAAGYITNTTPLSGAATTMVIEGNGYVNTNLTVTIGSEANPTTVLATSSTGSGWGSEYTYYIPEGTTYIMFACSSSSTYDAGITSITFGEVSTDDSTTTEPEIETEPETDDSTSSDEFIINYSSLGVTTSTATSGTATIGGVEWTFESVSKDSSYETIYVNYETAGYITNTTPLSGETATITILGNSYVSTNLVVTIGEEADPTTVLASTGYTGSSYDCYHSYTIPEGTKYVKFAANTSGTYNASLTSISFAYSGDTTSTELPDGVVEGEAYSFGGTTIMSAMGKTTDDFVDQRISILDCTLDNGLNINGEQGTHSSLVPCVWNGSSTDVRIYAGNNLVFSTTNGKKIISITFTSTHNYMTTDESGYSYYGDSSSSEWRGYADEVTFSTSEASYIDSFIVTLEE